MGDTSSRSRSDCEAAMSSGGGAEETTKDTGEIEALFKTGKLREECPRLSFLWCGHLFRDISHPCCQLLGKRVIACVY